MPTQTFSIRLEQQTLNKFRKWCQDNDTTISDELRKFIWSKVGKPKNVVRKKRGRKTGTKIKKKPLPNGNTSFNNWFLPDERLPEEMDFE